MDDFWFEQIASASRHGTPAQAPARLKSRLYSAVVAAMRDAGPLLDLAQTKQAGGRLCVFEEVVAVLPDVADARARNPCRMCHARILGERMEHAPIFWRGCPYSEFHNG